MQQEQSKMSLGETLKITFTSFLIGILAIIILLICTYFLAKIMDYYCSHSVAPNIANQQQYINGGRIARDTGLSGLSRYERRCILDKIFLGNTKSYYLSENNTNVEDFEENITLEESHKTCAICINDYAQGEQVIEGNICHHMFHRDCLLEWLGDQRKDICPCCRVEMITCDEYTDCAMNVLGDDRVSRVIMEYDPRRNVE